MQIRDVPTDGYERVVHASDPETGLDAFIAVHDTTLGPALGGLRMWPYTDRQAALTDVLRLARGMTYKSAIARTGLGGGKSVIIGDPRKLKTKELLHAMGRFVQSLDGLYITAEDMNISVRDLEELRTTTPHVTGLSRERGGSGNPSPYTGLGVYLGIRTCLEEVFGSPDCAGRHVAVQGVGAVARTVIEHLLEAGARVTATDIDEEKVELVARAHPEIAWVVPEAIASVECDVFSPHAMGAVLNDATLPQLRCRIVAGAANNQLAEDRHGEELRRLGILYAPDFVINAGGIINVSCEFDEGGYSESHALAKIENIATALKSTFEHARGLDLDMAAAARKVAQEILDEAREKA